MEQKKAPLSQGKTPKLLAVRSAISTLNQVYLEGSIEEKRSLGWAPPIEIEDRENLFCCIFLNRCCYRSPKDKKPLVILEEPYLSEVRQKFPILLPSIEYPYVKYFVCIPHFRKPESAPTIGIGKGDRSDILAKWVENKQIPHGYWLRTPDPPKSNQFRSWHTLNAEWKKLRMSNNFPNLLDDNRGSR